MASEPKERVELLQGTLDLIVLRALAKNPRNRYQSAEEMDADLERVGRGLNVSDTTETAATMVLAGGPGADSTFFTSRSSTSNTSMPAGALSPP